MSGLKTGVVVLLTVLLAGCMRESDFRQPNTNRGNMQALWQLIDERYCFLDEKGIDWERIGRQYLAAADTVSEGDERALFGLMASMLDSLRDGHVNLYSPFDVSRNKAWYEGYPDNYDDEIVYSDRYLGDDYHLAGGLQYRHIDDSVGLIRYPSFQTAFGLSNMNYVLHHFIDCKGIILDVRDNGGGFLDYSYRLAATFFDEAVCVGYIRHKTGAGHADFSPEEQMTVDPSQAGTRWLRPVVVLCNRNTYSTANHFVNAMRYAPNCLIIGCRTGGGGGLPMSYELPNGWIVRFSAVPMTDRDRQSIEDGIEPHLRVDYTDAAVALGEDRLIETARQIILKAYQNNETN